VHLLEFLHPLLTFLDIGHDFLRGWHGRLTKRLRLIVHECGCLCHAPTKARNVLVGYEMQFVQAACFHFLPKAPNRTIQQRLLNTPLPSLSQFAVNLMCFSLIFRRVLCE